MPKRTPKRPGARAPLIDLAGAAGKLPPRQRRIVRGLPGESRETALARVGKAPPELDALNQIGDVLSDLGERCHDDSDRGVALRRALEAATCVVRVAQTLADDTAEEYEVRCTIRDATRFWNDTASNRTQELRAALDLVEAIESGARPADPLFDGLLKSFDSTALMADAYLAKFQQTWPEYGRRLKRDVFMRAVEAWAESERTARSPKWGAVCRAVNGAGLGPKTAGTLERQWRMMMSARRRALRAAGWLP